MNIRSLQTALLCILCALCIAGCSYHTYYGDDAAPAGDYELKGSTPVSREKVVERHYVVE
ncbi:MAG: hypothetical protein RBU23_03245 [Candidatus Auribacterota bacterium]|jgi:L-lactate utilization protein LutB|nr:hypothetical protein [Candidatus Auribacterota bacterium]